MESPAGGAEGRPEPQGGDVLWMTVPLDDQSGTWAVEYTWTPARLAKT
jgi:hypothetical protein